MAAHDDRFALITQLANHVLHVSCAERVEATGRLVEQHEIGVIDKRLGQANSASHPLGIFLELAAAGVIQVDEFDELVGPLSSFSGRNVKQTPVKVERLLGVQKPVQIRLFGEIADPFIFGDI